MIQELPNVLECKIQTYLECKYAKRRIRELESKES